MTDSKTTLLGYSGPRSGRVPLGLDVLPRQGVMGVVTGPESSGASSATSARPPERGGSHAERGTLGRQRTASDRLHSVRDSLSDRDRLILVSLDQHPYLTTLQLQRLHFADHASADAAGRVCRRVLRRLAGLRVIEHLERRVGGVRAGSASFVWRLGPVGDRLLRQLHGDDGRARRKEPSLRYLEHCLLAAETHIRLLEAGRAGQLEVLRLEAEPACWRRYLTASAVRAVLKPDLAAVTASGEYEDYWFIEVDRGTESLPTLLKKCAQYEQYRRTGHEQQRTGVFPRVLWLLPDEVRLTKFERALKQARTLDPALHRLTTLENLIPAVLEAAA